MSLATINIFEICQKVEVRVFVAGAVEKGPGSFWPMGAKLPPFKVGVLHFMVLDAMQSLLPCYLTYRQVWGVKKR